MRQPTIPSLRLLLLAVLLALVGCKRSQAPKPTPPTLAEAETFARQYVSAKVPCDVAELEKLVDLDLILARAVEGTRVSEKFVRGLRRGMKPEQILCPELYGAGYSAVYLRTQTIDGTFRPLIRFVGDGGYTYEQLELDRRADKIVVADIYNYANGAQHSWVFRNLLQSMTDQGGAKELGEITNLRHSGKLDEALAVFQKLPAKLRATKEMMLLEVQLVATLDEAISLPAFERLAKAFPDDPAMLIMNIDRHTVLKQYEQQLVAIDKLDRAVGGDPYLELARSDAYLALGRLDEALAGAKRVTVKEPLLIQAQWQLLALQVKAGDVTDAVATVARMHSTLAADVTRDTLAGDDRFKALIETPEYIAWEAAN